MRGWLDRLGIQNLLFAVCGLITLLAALAVGWNAFNTVRVQAYSVTLLRTFDSLQTAYDAQATLKRVESVEQQYVRRPDLYLLDEAEGYRAQLDTFLREETLRAETAEEKTALYEMAQTRQDYWETFVAIVWALDAGDPAEVSRLTALSTGQMEEMEEQIGVMTHQRLTAFAATDERIRRRDIMTLVITSLALVSFLLLAIAAARIIHRRLNEPVLLLTEAARAVTEGASSGGLAERPAADLAPRLEALAAQADEMGQLARAFVCMENAVRLREDDLRRQADEIRAKIEQAQR